MTTTMMIRVPRLSLLFDEREEGMVWKGEEQKAGKISDASVSRLLKCPLKLLLLRVHASPRVTRRLLAAEAPTTPRAPRRPNGSPGESPSSSKPSPTR